MASVSLYRLVKARRWNGRLEPGFSRAGRWHSGGRALVYTAESPALALLEWIKGKFAQNLLEQEVVAARLVLIEFRCVLREGDIHTPDLSSLPPRWWAIPNNRSTATQAIGNAWLDAHERLAMRVPSAALPASLTPAAGANLLLDAGHPAFPALVADGHYVEHHFDLGHYLGFPAS